MNQHQILQSLEDHIEKLRDHIDGPLPLNLGQIEDGVRTKVKESKSDDPHLIFDFAWSYPTTFSSYRGDYSKLAIAYSGEYSGITASQFLEECVKADGGTFEGWKGGTHRMSVDTDVWVACPGRLSDTRIVDVTLDKYEETIVLVTLNIETW